MDNYRPVAQGPIPCIILEKLIVDHLNAYLQLNSLLDPHQHGFTAGRSTSTQLVEMTHAWANFINEKTDFACVYFDLSKAFDRVSHSLLLSKLRCLGVDSKTLGWIESYLSGRSFRVKIGSTRSQLYPASSGVPQGSVLGPLLFNLFVRDISRVIPSTVTYKLYADDLKLFGPVSPAGCIDLQRAIDAVELWCSQNSMLLSSGKCAVLSSCDLVRPFRLAGAPLPCVPRFRDLGVIMDPGLKFSSHLTSVIKSAAVVVNMVFRCFVVKSPDFYLHLYKSLVLPKLTYCSEVWRPYLSSDLRALENVQRRFLRRVSMRCSVSPDSLSLPPLTDLFDRADRRLFDRLSLLESFDTMFSITENARRSGTLTEAKSRARTDVVKNSYVWRFARSTRRA